MGGSPRNRGDSPVLTADDAIMLPLASQQAALPASVWPTGRVLTTTEMWVICTCVFARAQVKAHVLNMLKLTDHGTDACHSKCV